MNKELLVIKKQITPILREYRVTKAGIFGSYARGEQNKKSDIDILVKIDNETDLIELIRLRTKLQRMIKKKVDIVEYGSIRKKIKNSILNDEIQIL
ncbi:nucleotidyltransferase domain-containing protein [Candidatus Pacearchaeota archaeon]|nr:nucleotidyltransferase domain-containing protein [Candidatus Pacearchaeota archaeon]